MSIMRVYAVYLIAYSFYIMYKVGNHPIAAHKISRAS